MEFMAIADAQQPEIENAWAALDLVMKNQFIDTATEDGVVIWEQELNIMPLSTDTLDERKQRIKAAWLYGVVYTYNWLVDWIKTSCGNDNPPPTIDGYVLRTYLPVSSDYNRILNDMRRYIAANVLIDPLILLTKIRAPHYTGAAFRSGVKQQMLCDSWSTSNIQMLADENGSVLMEEAENKILYEEVLV
jgi:hypothetical protein